MNLETIDSFLYTLIIVLPGFILIKASDHLLGKSPFRDNFDFTIWSSFLSLCIYFSSNLFSKIAFEYSTTDKFIISTAIISLSFLIVYIIIVRCGGTKKLRHLIMGNYALQYNPDNSVWDAVLPGYSDYAIVYTSDGMKYGGTILLYTKGIGKDGNTTKELFLNEPVILNPTEKLEDYENDLKGLLLLEQDIKRIEFLGQIEEQKSMIVIEE